MPYDLASKRSVCVIGSDIRDKLFKGMDPVHRTLQLGHHEFRVIGVMEKQGGGFLGGPNFDRQIFIPITSYVRTFGGRRGHVDVTIAVKAPSQEATADLEDVVIGTLRMALPGTEHPQQHFVLYVGPVEYFRLSALKLQLDRAVDLGWIWVLPFSRALLQLMNWLYGLIPNYGVSIILLATLVRVVLHPLNMSSMKSQRAMMKIQPEVERVRARHKANPTAMNAAIMALYKENKVNPAGGCLPMVVQMPLFIALYSVLFNAIELRQAPFFGWIGDLSAPDLVSSVASFPIRLLPILMAGSGFLTQLLTPTDPKQKPTMYLMNVMMLVFFYNLPSGLVLYWTIMNLLTAAQQWLVMRQDGGSSGAVVEVVSPAVERRGKKG